MNIIFKYGKSTRAAWIWQRSSSGSQEPGAPAAGPRAGGCAWGRARVLVRVLVDPDGVLVMSVRVLVRVLVMSARVLVKDTKKSTPLTRCAFSFK